METHAHDLHKAPGHGWKHYFFEFFMLFLAVFCGFLAENLREQQVEHHREKEFITSLVRDVELDIVSLQQSSVIKKKYCNYFDSLVFLLKENKPNSRDDIYFYGRWLGRITEFAYHDRTIQELKSTGSLRLISNKAAAESITVYDNEVAKVILTQQQIEHELRTDMMVNQIGKIFNGYIWNDMVDSNGIISRTTGNPELATSDGKLINDFIVHVVHLKTSYRLTDVQIKAAIKEAEKLVDFLKKEYQLE